MPTSKKKTRRDHEIAVEKILHDFEKSETSHQRRKGKFKIEASFDEAMKKILKAKPEPKPSKSKIEK